jgi:hypothetical protein
MQGGRAYGLLLGPESDIACGCGPVGLKLPVLGQLCPIRMFDNTRKHIAAKEDTVHMGPLDRQVYDMEASAPQFLQFHVDRTGNLSIDINTIWLIQAGVHDKPYVSCKHVACA